jgi:hypothetical protein
MSCAVSRPEGGWRLWEAAPVTTVDEDELGRKVRGSIRESGEGIARVALLKGEIEDASVPRPQRAGERDPPLEPMEPRLDLPLRRRTLAELVLQHLIAQGFEDPWYVTAAFRRNAALTSSRARQPFQVPTSIRFHRPYRPGKRVSCA